MIYKDVLLSVACEVKVKVKSRHSVMSNSLQPVDCSPPSFSNGDSSWDSPGKNTGVGCHFLLQGMVYSSYNDPIYPEVEVKLTLTVIFEVQYL